RSLIMKIHEYQAKELLAKYGVPIPKGRVATTPEEAAEITTELGGKAIVKAQVHAGGRGKAGGIKVVSSAEEAAQATKDLIGTTLVTFQTGPEGAPVGSVLVEELVDVETELYVGMAIDGATEGVVAIASSAGGMEIEEVAETTPEKLLRVSIDPVLGLQPFQGRRIAYGLGVDDSLVRPISALMDSIYKVFEESDCSLVEINPLGITTDGRILAMDAKLNIDDDAVFRHRDLQPLRDTDQEDALEVEARESDINYVKLDGDIGCIVNGAGLAMATMDVTHSAGAAPANFLDIGGGADEAKVARALSIVLSDPDVKTVLVNLFGGILRCDVAARGFLQAAEEAPDAMKPMIVRMLGTNSDEGREIMANSGLDVVLVDNLNQAADAIRAATGQ
ncbi:MAG: ADP-forming succinate--CoA ligase subunit beta, partial [Dehalococcoidia bacterium]